MSRDWLTLEDGEEVLWAASPRVQTVLPWLAVGLALAVVPFVLSGVPRPVALVGVLPPALAYLYVTNTEFVVTNRRCYRKSGVLSRSVLAVSFETVENSAYEQGVLGTAFGYGTVEIDTAGGMGTELTFWKIADPRSVQSLVLDQRDAARTGADEIPGTVEQWQAVLAEVRRLRAAAERHRRSVR
ncbi:PH domain-containing protein [Haloarchaeobius sp. HRN-SO-5]|uniref:PH domain-containing protein n=1 Tax=Haloarchaeobius sp. HRN-SO-5 TaxID=3446118 RepID=UPI003EB92C6A